MGLLNCLFCLCRPNNARVQQESFYGAWTGITKETERKKLTNKVYFKHFITLFSFYLGIQVPKDRHWKMYISVIKNGTFIATLYTWMYSITTFLKSQSGGLLRTNMAVCPQCIRETAVLTCTVTEIWFDGMVCQAGTSCVHGSHSRTGERLSVPLPSVL